MLSITKNLFSKKKKIGLALGGGAVLGAAHIGVLRALEEFRVPITHIAGCSIGAFIGALYAFGKSSKEIEDFAEDIKWFEVSRITLSQYALLTNKKIKNIFHDTIGDVGIEQAKIPLIIIATDISSGEKVEMKSGDIASAVMASTCVPGVFKPVQRDGKLLVDGGVVENVPVATLDKIGCDIIIGVDLVAGHIHRRPDNILGVLVNTLYFMLQSATKLQTKEADILIAPDLSHYNFVDIDQVSDLIEIGYQEAKKALENKF